jgi:integrase
VPACAGPLAAIEEADQTGDVFGEEDLLKTFRDPRRDYPRGQGIQVIRDDTPLACWLPIEPGLTVHGLRHGLKTWMAEDGIPEILAEQRLGHQVPDMRGFYAHASERMRSDLKQALQAPWEDSLRDRAAIAPRSPPGSAGLVVVAGKGGR